MLKPLGHTASLSLTVYIIASLCFLSLQEFTKREPLMPENFTTSKRKILLMKTSAIKQSIMLWFILTWKLQAKYTNVGWVLNHCTHCDCKSQVTEDNALIICKILKGQQRVLWCFWKRPVSTVRLPIIALSQDFRSLVGNLNMISDGVMQMSLFCMQQRKYSQTLLMRILGAEKVSFSWGCPYLY